MFGSEFIRPADKPRFRVRPKGKGRVPAFVLLRGHVPGDILFPRNNPRRDGKVGVGSVPEVSQGADLPVST